MKLNFRLIIGIVLIISIIIFVNILASQVPWKYDMTYEKVFTLSPQTEQLLSVLDSNIDIHVIGTKETINPMVKELLEVYISKSKGKIALDYINVNRSPHLAAKYDPMNEGLLDGTVIFEGLGKMKKIQSHEILPRQEVTSTYTFNGEQKFTGAILSLINLNNPTIYFIEGHQEKSIYQDLHKLRSRIESEGYNVKQLNLLKSHQLPENTDLLVFASPKSDLTNTETEAIQHYMERGGRVIFLFDLLNEETSLVNFNTLLAIMGTALKNNVVIEEDQSSYYSDNKMYLIPDLITHPILDQQIKQKKYVIMPFSNNISIQEDADSKVTIEPLLKSTPDSWIRYNLSSDSPTISEEDETGPATIAVAATRDNYDEKYNDTKIILSGNARFIEDGMVDVQGNFDFFMNGANWLLDKEQGITIRPKFVNTNKLYVTGSDYIILIIISVLIAPLTAFCIGLGVWFRRRHR